MNQVLSHRSDTVAAHEAAEFMEKSGKAIRHKARVIESVSNKQGMTGAEIGDATGLGHIEAQRRISDLINQGLLEYRSRRKCKINGTSMSTVYLTKNGAGIMNTNYVGQYQ